MARGGQGVDEEGKALTSWEVVLAYPNGHLQPTGMRFGDADAAKVHAGQITSRMADGHILPATIDVQGSIEAPNYRMTAAGPELL